MSDAAVYRKVTGYEPGFRTLERERDGVDLPVEGEVPAWLSGALVRNGPAKFEVDGERVAHWFDGLAMLHKFRFDGGDVTYSNRFLRTDAYRRATEEGRLTGQFATAGSYRERLRSLVRTPTDNASVNVARIGGEHVALTETPRRVRFDPETLATLGDLAYADDLPAHHVTAHPCRDPERGETVAYATEFGRPSRYRIYRVPDDRPERIEIASIAVDRPAYLHSFGLTRRYVVLVEPPFVVNPLRFLLPGGAGFVDRYRWRPKRGTRWLVVDRESGDVVTRRRTTALFFFHVVDAFETDGDVVVDLVAYDDATIVENLFLSSLDGPGGLQTADGELTRVHLPLDGDSVRRRRLYRGMELPRVAPTAWGRPARYAYGQLTGRAGGNGLVKVDLGTGEAEEWFEEGYYAEEPVFVPAPDAEGEREDRGVVLATVLDVDAERSFLLVLDGETFAERARAPLPHHLPFGFHGEFFPAVTD